MPDSFVSPYGITLREGGMIEVIPIVEVSFLSRDKKRLSIFLIVDSGAFISALPKSDAIGLGIIPEQGNLTTITGMGGEPIVGWQHIINIRLKNKSLKLPVVFLDSDNVPRVLGREGIFDRFTLVFEESKRRTGFLEGRTKDSRKVSEVLDLLARS